MPEVIRVEDCHDLVKTEDFPYAYWDFESFNPVQSRLLQIYENDTNVAIAAATSAGKTVCSEIYAAYENKVRKGKTIYIGPLKSLCSEKQQDWTSETHHFSKLKIAIMTGDFRMTVSRIKELDKADVIVMTPEMLASRCRNHASEKSNFLKEVGTIIFDESHLLTVPGRGDHMEVALMKLMTINPDVRVVLLSATMPNVDEICGWVSKITKRNTYFLESDYRPCPLNLHYETYYDGDKNYDAQELNKVGSACSIVDYYEEDKFLIFVHTKRTGQLMLKHLKRHGVDAEFHNADLSFKERQALEDKFKNNPKFRVVVATSTLAWGCNLPSRRVIVTGLHRGLTVVENYDIQQMIGRAGRPRYDKQGDAYILVPESQKDEAIMRLRQPTKIQSTMLDYVGTAEEPHYKTLAFHVVSEIHQGVVKTADGFKDWFKNSLAYYQEKSFDIDVLDRTLGMLERCKAIKIQDGEYQATSIGKIASMFYYSPFDVSDLRRNFHFLFEQNNDNNDFALAMALGNVDSNKWSICNRHEQEEMAGFETRVQKLFGNFRFQKGALKYGYAYYNLLQGRRNIPAFQNTQSAILFDLERQMQILYSLNKMASKWEKDKYLQVVKLRLIYGVTADLVQLCQIPKVGQVRGERLKSQGIKTPEQVVNLSVSRLATIMKCSSKIAEEALNGAKQIILENSLN